jgi:hypothetical protein
MEPTSNAAECDSFRDDLAMFAVGGPTDSERAKVLSHLEGCLQCAAERESLSVTVDALLTILVQETIPPARISKRTMAMIRTDAGHRAAHF